MMTDTIEIVDEYLGKRIEIRCDHVFEAHYFVLQTLSQSEQGFELTEQGVSIAMNIPFSTKFVLRGRIEVNDV
jgi:hypothetical protein